MDLSLSFSSPQRRNPRLELPFPTFKSKSYDNNVMPIHLPIESDSSNSMFETPSGCRVTRWMFPNYSSNCGYIQKSFHFNKSNASGQKMTVPKIPSIALSFSQQTIVGGFVGSKSHAGRSFFGESSQLWDAVMCKFIQLMNLAKEKTYDNLSDAKCTFSDVKNSKTCDLNSSSLNKGRPNESIPNRVEDTKFSDSNSITIKTRSSGINNLHSRLDKMSNNSPNCVSPEVCDYFYSVKNEQTIENRAEIPSTTQRKTYSSVVDRTCKNNTQCVRPESCAVIKSQTYEQPLENRRANLLSPLKQSYADVAKIIPHKSFESQKKVSYEMMQTFKKRVLNCKSSRDKKNYRNSPTKKVSKSVNSSTCPSLDDFMVNGDTRWRPKFQKSKPVTVPSRSNGSVDDGTIGKDVGEEWCTKDSVIGSESGRCGASIEARKTEFSKAGMRGRYPSECSLDSDDSFVVFEDCPDAAMSSSPYSSPEQNSYLEVDEEFADDESISSSDDSDSEDASLDNGDSLNSSPVANNSKLQKANCKWVKGCSAYTVPESGSKVLRKKKVHFAEGCHLAVVRPMIAWGYAYRESRRGPWEIHARDRARFHCRIDCLAPLLNLVLDPKHRKRILESRFSDS